MKKSNAMSALIAFAVSALVVGGYHFYTKKTISKEQQASTIQASPTAGTKVLYTKDEKGEIIPLDFTETTDKVLDAVVHITSMGTRSNGPTVERGYRELPDPFKKFFQDRGGLQEYFKAPHGQEQRPGGEARQQPVMGTGSGVIINTEGYIITNNHVIDGADDIQVTLHDNQTFTAKVIGTDPTTDLALLYIDAEDLNSLSLVNSDDVKVGEWVLAIGNPFSLNSTVTAGIVSAKARNININKDRFAVESFIQTDAAINPGNSGGALVNLNGDLIGVNTAIASRTGSYSGYGFAVPSNMVTKVVEDLLKYGDVQRGVLGVSIRTMDSNLAKKMKVDFLPGIYVAEVGDDGAADKAGMENGDIIVAVDGTPVTTSPLLQELIARHRPGDKVTLKINRDGKEMGITAVLQNRNGGNAILQKERKETLGLLGADFQELNKKQAEELGVGHGVQITRLFAGKLRRDTQLREGFIITHINGKKVYSVEDVIMAIEGKKGGVMLEGVYPNSDTKKYYAFSATS